MSEILAGPTVGGPCAPPPFTSQQVVRSSKQLDCGFQKRPSAKRCEQHGTLSKQHFSSEVTQDPSPISQSPNEILDSGMNSGSGSALKIMIQIEFPINKGLRVRFPLTWSNVMFLLTEVWSKTHLPWVRHIGVTMGYKLHQLLTLGNFDTLPPSTQNSMVERISNSPFPLWHVYQTATVATGAFLSDGYH